MKTLAYQDRHPGAPVMQYQPANSLPLFPKKRWERFWEAYEEIKGAGRIVVYERRGGKMKRLFCRP